MSLFELNNNVSFSRQIDFSVFGESTNLKMCGVFIDLTAS